MRASLAPHTLRHRLLLITAACLLTTFLGMTAVIVFGLPYGLLPGELHQQEHNALARLGAVADNKKTLLALWFNEWFGDLKLASQNPLLAAFSTAYSAAEQVPARDEPQMEQRRQEVIGWLQSIRQAYDHYDHLEVVTARVGAVILSTDESRAGAKMPLPLKNAEEIPIPGELAAFLVSEDDGKTAHLCLAVHLASPAATATPMALVFHIDTSILIDKLRDIPLLGASGEIQLVDMNQILLTPLRHPANGKPDTPLQTRLESKLAQYAAWGNDGTMQAEDSQGVPVLAAVRHIRILPDFGLGLVVKQDQAEVFAPIYQRVTTLATVAGAGALVLLLAIFFMARSLLKPLEGVAAAARRLQGGDLTARATATGQEQGEVQVLATAFNAMAEEVQNWNERLNAIVAERTAELQDRTGQLEALNAELESFNHTVSHDLRTPIRALAGFPDLLETHLGERLDDKGRQYLAAIRSAARRMSEITTGLLNFSRLGRVDLAMSDVDLAVLVSKVREDLAAMSEGRQVEWQVSELPVVKGDPLLLRIALTNLLSNALKFSRQTAAARIRVTAALDEDGAPTVTVSDNGTGFDMKYADRLFKMFSRLHPSETFEGTGIGLATVSRIVRRHGGRIWALSTPGAGASFSFTLAVAPRDAPHAVDVNRSTP